jgi:hypothetical protein
VVRAMAVLVLIAACLQAPAEDASNATDGGILDPACDEVFGGARGYVLCDSDDASCTFFINLEGDFTCATACDTFGVSCLDGYEDRDTESKCEVDVRIGCDELHSDEICQCARPPA